MPSGENMEPTSVDITEAVPTVDMACAYRDVGDRLAGPTAFATLASLKVASQGQLCLVLSKLKTVDVAGALVIREAVRSHLVSGRTQTVELWEPRDQDVWARVHDLIGRLPSRTSFARDRGTPVRDRAVLVPVTELEDREAIELVQQMAIPAAGAATGVPARVYHLAAAMFAELADNAASRVSDGQLPSVCVASEGRNSLTVAMWNDGPSFADRNEAEARLTGDGSILSGINSTAALGLKTGVAVDIELASGEVRAFLRAGRWLIASGERVPGFAISARITQL